MRPSGTAVALLERMPDSSPQLGLVCVTASEEIRFRTITRTRLLKLDPALQVIMLRELYADNIRRLSAAIEFCRKNAIQLYRISSGLFPSSEDAPGFDVLEEFRSQLAATGRRATELGIRIVAHPDQFVVLNSESDAIIANSVKVLRHHARVMDLLAQPRSAWATLEIHGGKGGRSAALIENIRALPEEIRSRLALENDEFAYSAAEILEVCRGAGVPMVFDAHHHLCCEGLDSYEDPSVVEFVNAARETWPNAAWQMVHISNGKEGLQDPRHSDFITTMPSAFDGVPFIEVEAKQKELAIRRLRRRWQSAPRARASKSA